MVLMTGGGGASMTARMRYHKHVLIAIPRAIVLFRRDVFWRVVDWETGSFPYRVIGNQGRIAVYPVIEYGLRNCSQFVYTPGL